MEQVRAVHIGPGTLRRGQSRKSGEAGTQALDGWGAVGEGEQPKQSEKESGRSQAQALQPFAGSSAICASRHLPHGPKDMFLTI